LRFLRRFIDKCDFGVGYNIAPDESVTVPLMAPVTMLCALAALPAKRKSSASKDSDLRNCVLPIYFVLLELVFLLAVAPAKVPYPCAARFQTSRARTPPRQRENPNSRSSSATTSYVFYYCQPVAAYLRNDDFS